MAPPSSPRCARCLLRAQDAQPDDVLGADGYLFATPENLASMSGLMKDFFDRTYYAALDRINGRPYAVMVCAGSDGQGAIRQLERIALGWRLEPSRRRRWSLPMRRPRRTSSAPKTIDPVDLQRCEELGATLAAGLGWACFKSCRLHRWHLCDAPPP